MQCCLEGNPKCILSSDFFQHIIFKTDYLAGLAQKKLLRDCGLNVRFGSIPVIPALGTTVRSSSGKRPLRCQPSIVVFSPRAGIHIIYSSSTSATSSGGTNGNSRGHLLSKRHPVQSGICCDLTVHPGRRHPIDRGASHPLRPLGRTCQDTDRC